MTSLMNEWPTLVRIGVPPALRIVSGTALEQMRLCTIDAPGRLARYHSAMIAVVVLPGRGTPSSSTKKARSASPSKATARSGRVRPTRSSRSAMFSGRSGSAGWLGKVPSGSRYSPSRRGRQPVEHRRDGHPGHPVAAVGGDPQRGDRVGVDDPEEMVDVVGDNGPVLGPPPVVGVADALLGQPADVGQPAVLTHGGRPDEAELEPVVLGGVVRRGDHHSGLGPRPRGVVESVRGHRTEHVHIDALGGDPVDECRHQLG